MFPSGTSSLPLMCQRAWSSGKTTGLSLLSFISKAFRHPKLDNYYTVSLQPDLISLIDFLNLRTEEAGERILYFERQGLGSVHLNYEESSRYHKCLRSLAKSSVKDDDLSSKTVERAGQTHKKEA